MFKMLGGGGMNVNSAQLRKQKHVLTFTAVIEVGQNSQGTGNGRGWARVIHGMFQASLSQCGNMVADITSVL